VVGGLLIAAVVVTLLLVFSGSSGLNLIGISPSFQNTDPYFGRNNSHVVPWDNGGSGGLKLQVLNSLESKWTAEFNTALSQWDNGSPDALTLSNLTITPDSTCAQAMGKLKVCNGDYGQTDWLGINEQLIDGSGYLISSAARMNDHYLDTAVESQRQYTMCHEMGHGFGLPHTDENFNNADLGNCLDYTVHPWVNEQPAAMNFDLLAKTYGTVGGRRRGLGKATTAMMGVVNDVDGEDESEQVIGGSVISTGESEGTVSPPVRHPDWIIPAFSHAVRRLHEVGHTNAAQEGWTAEHRSRYGEVHSRQLGGGYVAKVHIMLSTNLL
jgi:hypothetical protein